MTEAVRKICWALPTIQFPANLPHVAGLLGISVAQLVSGSPETHRAVPADVRLIIDMNSSAYTVVDNFDLNPDPPHVSITVPVERHTFIMRVHGDSMVGERGDSFPEGSVIVVEPDFEALDGDYVIAIKPGKNVTFRQLVRDGADLYLKPLNTRYPREPLGTSSVLGVIREFSKRFR